MRLLSFNSLPLIFTHHGTCTAVCSSSTSQWFLYIYSESRVSGEEDEEEEKEEEGHWLSSKAQTCCGHPVRPFTFFSAPKDSCRPSVYGVENEEEVKV